MPFIVQTRVGADHRVREHPGKSLRLGRGSNVDVRFLDPGIEYEHALIEDTPFGFVVRDLGSSSGTRVNGERVGRAELRDGDRIDLGVYEVRLRISGFGDYRYLFLDVEEIGADDASSLSGLHSITMSFASRELQDLASAARARHQMEEQEAARRVSEAPTGPMRALAESAEAAEEVSASAIFELFTASGIDLRSNFANFDRSLRESIDVSREGEGGPAPSTVRALPVGSRTSEAKPKTRPEPDAETRPEAEPTTGSEARRSPTTDLSPAAGWSTSLMDGSGFEDAPPALRVEEAPAAPAPAPGPAQVPAARRGPEPPSIDYLSAYGLPGGLGVAWTLASVVLLLGMGSVTVTAVRHTDLLSPGPLGGLHAEAEGLGCASCHTGFVGVEQPSCVRCHERIHDHQQVMADDRGCIDCHTEHRGGDALRLVDTGICVSCHAALPDTQAAAGKFADRITAFSVDHPEFAVYTEPGRRVRLDTRAARTSDPGGLKGFDHYWHMEKLPTHLRRECGDCHRQDDAGEILAVEFESSCRECHQLAFDPRFPGEQTPHDNATVVTGYLVGHYVQNRDVLRRLTPRERRLGGGSLSAEERLTRVAQAVTERVLRDQCNTCHVLTRPAGERDPTRVDVKPVRITERWFPHAEPFPHGQHVKLTQCADCHALAAASRETSDLILPSLGACKTCHRPAEEVEREPERLARATCRTCHSYHAGPVEVRSWQQASVQ